MKIWKISHQGEKRQRWLIHTQGFNICHNNLDNSNIILYRRNAFFMSNTFFFFFFTFCMCINVEYDLTVSVAQFGFLQTDFIWDIKSGSEFNLTVFDLQNNETH